MACAQHKCHVCVVSCRSTLVRLRAKTRQSSTLGRRQGRWQWQLHRNSYSCHTGGYTQTQTHTYTHAQTHTWAHLYARVRPFTQSHLYLAMSAVLVPSWRANWYVCVRVCVSVCVTGVPRAHVARPPHNQTSYQPPPPYPPKKHSHHSTLDSHQQPPVTAWQTVKRVWPV